MTSSPLSPADHGQPEIVHVPARGSQSASRAASMLQLLADELRPASLTQIAGRLSLAKSSALGVLVSLEASGLVRREENNYTLGVGVLHLAASFLRSLDVVAEFRHAVPGFPLLDAEVLQVATLSGRDVVYLARHSGRSPLPATAGVGDRFPASITAVGAALLSQLDDAEIASRFASPDAFPLWTGASTASLPALLTKIQATRANGYAIDIGETNPDVYGVAVVIHRAGRYADDIAVGASLRPRRSVTPQYRDRVVHELQGLKAALEATNVIE